MEEPTPELKDFATFTVHGPNGLVVGLTEDKPFIELKLRTSSGNENDTAAMRAILSVSQNGMFNVHVQSGGNIPFGILHRLYTKANGEHEG